MRNNFQNALERVLLCEGGWSNHPKDPGGPTMRGVTLAVYSAFKRKPATPDELRNISDDDLSAIYKRQYWDTVRGDELPVGLDYALFDYAVNSGPGRAVRDLQRVVGVQPDGVMGAMTLQAVSARDPAQIIAALCDKRLAFLKSLKTWGTFGKGWGKRVETVRTASLSMASGIEGGVIEAIASGGKAKDQDISALRTPEGKAKIAAGAGAVGTAASQVAEVIQPFAGQWKWIGGIAACLLIVGILANVIVQQMADKPIPEAA